MIEPDDPHTPSPEFRLSLKRDISREIRRSQLAAHRMPRFGRLATVLAAACGTVFVLGIGLVLGTNTGYASARVEGRQQRNNLAGTVTSVATQFAALRQDMARMRNELSHNAAIADPASRAALNATLDGLRALETNAARIEFDLAQGRESAVVPQSTLLGTVPMKRALSLTCSALSFNPSPIAAPIVTTPTSIPTVELPQPSAKTTEPLGNVMSVRQTNEGRLLVSDGTRRQLILFDSLLATGTVVLDSMQGVANSYGPYGTPFIAYRGDSSLFSPATSARNLLVIDGEGRIARTTTLPHDSNTALPFIGMKGANSADNRGRIVYLNVPPTTIRSSPDGSASLYLRQPEDTLDVLRADLESRRVDTLGFVVQPLLNRLGQMLAGDGRTILKQTVNPLATVDEWALLSNGTVAFVRGQDYHVDWLHPDGTTSVGAKLPFEWKKLSDDDKRALIDSVRADRLAIAARAAANAARFNASGDAIQQGGGRSATPGARAGGGDDGARMGSGGARLGGGGGARSGGGEPGARVGGGGARGGGGGRSGGGGPAPMPFDFVSLDRIADYYPPIRRGAVLPDLDGNLWILPTTSSASRNGELVYDVVNEREGLFERVRMPAGRSVIGFGKDHTVYLLAGDRVTGFTLERTTLPSHMRSDGNAK